MLIFVPSVLVYLYTQACEQEDGRRKQKQQQQSPQICTSQPKQAEKESEKTMKMSQVSYTYVENAKLVRFPVFCLPPEKIKYGKRCRI